MKCVNFRFLFLCFVSLFIGMNFSVHLFDMNVGYIMFGVCLIVVLIVHSLTFSKIHVLLTTFVSFLLGFILSISSINAFEKSQIKFDTQCKIEATVLNYVESDTQIFCLLGDCSVDGNKTDFNLNLYIYGNTKIDFGQKVEFVSHLRKVELFNLGKFNSSAYNNNVKAICQANASDLVFGEIEYSYRTFVRAKLTSMLSKNVSEQFVDVFRAIIMGDSWGIDQDVRESFSDGGISHLLAISGLHIVFLVSLLETLLDKLRINKKVSFWTITTFLIMYCLLCGMSNSVVRASIMSICMLLSGVIGRKYDKLNSIGLAGLIVLLIKPLASFDLGFMLSFGAVLSIFLLCDAMKKIVSKLKIGANLTNSISVMLCAQLGILPILAMFYDSVNLFNLVSNLICVPMFEVAYIFTIIFVLIVVVMPFLGFFFSVPQMLMSGITLVAILTNKLTFLKITLSNHGTLFVVSAVLCYFVCSKYLMSSRKFKTAICLAIVGICCLCLGLSHQTFVIDQNFISCTTNASQSNYHYVFKNNDKIFVVGKMDDDENLEKFLTLQKITQIDYFIATGVYNLFDFSIKNVITYDSEIAFALSSTHNTHYVEKNKKFEHEDFVVEFVHFDDSFKYVHFKVPDGNYVVINSALTTEQKWQFYDLYEENYILCGKQEDCLTYNIFEDTKIMSVCVDNQYTNWSLYYDGEIEKMRSLN